jgi:hypothetical protein
MGKIYHPLPALWPTQCRMDTTLGDTCFYLVVQYTNQNTFYPPMCKISPATMRINTDGAYAWRTDLYDDVGDRLNESTRSGAIDASCAFTRRMLDYLDHAIDHPDMTPELATILSTPRVSVSYHVETSRR